MAATAERMALAHARARAASKKRAAWCRWCDATTGQEQAAAEREWNAAKAELDALPSLISPAGLARLQAAWAVD